MQLNENKCKAMHFGGKNGHRIYSMYKKDENRRVELGKTDTERDLGVVVSAGTNTCRPSVPKPAVQWDGSKKAS